MNLVKNVPNNISFENMIKLAVKVSEQLINYKENINMEKTEQIEAGEI